MPRLNNRLSLAFLVMTLSIYGCSGKPGASNTPTETSGGEMVETTGMLLILDPAKCPLADGCGPRFSLLGNDLQQQIALEGDFNDAENQRIVTVTGSQMPLSGELTARSGYERISQVIQVEGFEYRSDIPYHSFLTTSASLFSLDHLGCELLWDKSYSWSMEGDMPLLTVRMTDTFSTESRKPYVEISYDGNTGELIRASVPEQSPCQSE